MKLKSEIIKVDAITFFPSQIGANRITGREYGWKGGLQEIRGAGLKAAGQFSSHLSAPSRVVNGLDR